MAKLIVKRAAALLGMLLALPFILPVWLELLLFGSGAERIFGAAKETLSLVPTPIGEFMRLGFYATTCRQVSLDAKFMFGSMVAHRQTILASGVVVGVGTIVGQAEVGENVLFGARVSVLSGKYQHGRPGEDPKPQAEPTYEPVSIGRDSWVGQEAVIMANVGQRCTVAAGAVVMKDVPDGATFMGNPARKVNVETVAGPARQTVRT